MFQWIDEVKRMENKEKKQAKVQGQRAQAFRRSPRTIDIRKFYKESSSSGEEKKVKLGTVSLEFRLFSLCCNLRFNSLYFFNTDCYSIRSKIPCRLVLMGGPSTQTGGRLFLLIRGVSLGLVHIRVLLLLFQKPVKHLRSPIKEDEATKMPKRS